MKIRANRPVIVLAILLAGSSAAHGGVRRYYEDAIVVERSELIVVGRLSRESIRYVPYEDSHGVRSWEHHATLLVSEVLKGKGPGEEIPIVIYYGLEPRPNHGGVGIIDSREGSESFSPLIEDALEDNLWFLRKRAGVFGQEPGTGNYGMADPEDVQPLESKSYFLSYLAPHPEAAVAEYTRKNPKVFDRAKTYLDHLEVQLLLKIEDPSERFDKLLPYFLSRMNWNGKWEAREGILSCVPVAGEKLKTIFANPEHRERREDIIRVWRELGYRDAAPILIKLLSDADEFWKTQHLEKGWWNNFEAAETRQRQEIYSEMVSAIYALQAFRDPRAKEVLEVTRDRWKAINFDNPQIVEGCEAALRALPELEGAHQEVRQ